METNRFLVFYQSFEKVVKDIKKKETSYMSEYGLRSVHMKCLLRINQSEKGMTITQLSKASGTDKALISRMIKELACDGFLETKTAGEDKSYNKKYYLTEKSKKIASDINEDIGRYMAKAREGIPEDDMQQFYETLALLSNNISLIADGEE
jgi:DNA-binding MarR family transcriptional regulator